MEIKGNSNRERGPEVLGPAWDSSERLQGVKLVECEPQLHTSSPDEKWETIPITWHSGNGECPPVLVL